MKTLRFFVLNGPNLNLLGYREPEKYGTVTLEQINKELKTTLAEHFIAKAKNSEEIKFILERSLEKNAQEFADISVNFKVHTSFEFEVVESEQSYNVQLHFHQTNNEHELITTLHKSFFDRLEDPEVEDYFIINPAAFGHTSVALRDALLGVEARFVEVHLSNIHKREAFRHHTYLQDIAQGVICGLGAKGYILALNYWLDAL
ncbi:hypothetical protein CJP74_04220 [Psittacicella melopsittaci]|uniref:3-dehydroquinate dehydratase n=1 Tax=Psittacicella melopsittaci TaxID=2028576 RepID=A0A3A1Y557_9GAMM|nr:hypothetical protein CJP74_04220 [Psittacicella melopsittaci]